MATPKCRLGDSHAFLAAAVALKLLDAAIHHRVELVAAHFDNVGRWSRARWVGLRDGVEVLHPYVAAAVRLGHEQLQLIGL